MTRVLALDYGSARCGCAISDPTGTLATPLPEVAEPARPRAWTGSRGSSRSTARQRCSWACRSAFPARRARRPLEVREFVARLAERVTVPVRTWDERFTTKLAQTTPGRSSEDSRAAAHLLQGYLEAQT